MRGAALSDTKHSRKLKRVANWRKTWGKARSKAEWRRWAKETRAQLDIPVLSQEVVAQLERWLLYKQTEHVLTYLALKDELDLSRLSGKHLYATRAHTDGTLTIHSLTGNLERHPYGFWQPVANSPEVALGRLELLLVPGLAFDTSGNRLGYGKGFYDRLLAQINNVPIVGVVPSELIVPALPAEPHDIKMTHLLSEKGVLEVK